MKILLIQPSNATGGAELSALQVMEGLSRRYGVACHAALLPPDDSPYVSMLKRTCSGIIVVPLLTWNRSKSASPSSHVISLLYRFYRGRLIASIWKLLKYARAHDIDLIYSNSGLCPVGGIVARIAAIPHVWHVRERMGHDSEFPLFMGDGITRRLFQQWSDLILCNSYFTAGFFGGEIKALRVVMNGIETGIFCSEEAAERGRNLRQDLSVSDQDLMVAMVGSIFSSWKEHGVFLQTVRTLKDNQVKARYVIFGGSKEPNQSEYAHAVFQKAIDLGLETDLTFAEAQTDIPAIMNSIDIMVHPTSQEGSGRVIMEAMAAGKPVVGVHAGGVGELIRNGDNGFSVPANRPDLLAAAAKEIIQNEALRMQIGKRAREYAQSHFGLNRTQAEIYEVFKHVAQGA